MVNKGYKKTEIGIIPEDWNVKTFLEVGTYFKGSGISMRDVVFSGYPCIMYGDIYVKFDTHFSKCDYHVTAQTASRSTRAQHGDLFFTASGETAEEIGKCVSYQGEDDIFIGGDIIAIRPSIEYDSLFLAYVQNSALLINQKASYAQGCSVVHINSENIKKLAFASPSKRSEQRRIAEALSDIDTLINNLKKLIAKKKSVKQGTMQELLTGKKRLPGFSGEWIKKPLGVVALDIRTGKKNNEDKTPNGKYPFFVRSQQVETINSWSYDGEAVIIPGEGNIGQIFHYIVGKFDFHQRVYKISDFASDYDGKYVYYQMRMSFGKHALENTSKATVDSLRLPAFQEFMVNLPPTKEEQIAIALILSDMDSEITVLEEKLSKYRNIKTGMMQTLLTGRIRISEQEAPTVAVVPPIAIKKEKPDVKGHNQPFDDAVVIAAIVNTFYSDKYPLGRKKVQKLLYLLRRKQNACITAFKKKAAGPYADEVRYKGGEPIAKRNNYVTVINSKRGSMFAKGKDIGKALDYVAKWNMQPELDWLVEQFVHTKVDKLELLATIDMAMCDLGNSGVTASVDSVKKLIASNKEWKAKLKKTYFSDADIGWAITECLRMFNSKGR